MLDPELHKKNVLSTLISVIYTHS